MARLRLVAAVCAVTALTGGVATLTTPSGASPAAQASSRWLDPCPPAGAGSSTCLARVLDTRASSTGAASGSSGSQAVEPQTSTPSGLSPHAVTTAYGFPTTGGSGETIALVDAFDDPTIAANLTTFSNEFSLPACTTTNGCFTKVNQTGGTTYPKATSGWDLEISLDVEWTHALAPQAHILLVEASSNSDTSLFSAVSYAAKHAQYVSMSWGGSEFSSETSFDADFAAAPSVSFFASTGDSAGAILYPATSPDVLAVGGTTLDVTASSDAWESESAWSTAGGGCSAYEKATAAQAAYPSYDQTGANCAGKRATPDVALDANPTTGVAVYDTKALSTGLADWIQVGGTSASTAMWAGRSAASGAHVDATYVYGANIPFYNVTTGSNGRACEKGYNLCTGLGSWNETHGVLNGVSAGTVSFSGSAQTLVAGVPSAAMTLGLSAPAPAGGLAVTLTTSSAAGGFSLSPAGPFTASLSVAVPADTTVSPAFYYQDTKAGSPQLSAAAGGWASGTQTETVGPAPLARIALSPTSASLATGGTQTFSATGYDRYTNAVVTGFDPTWTTTLTGAKFSAQTGTSTTLTAGPGAGTGAVTATDGTVVGTASVTVKAVPALTVGVTAGTAKKSGATYKVALTVAVTGTSGKVSGAAVTLDVYKGSCTGTLAASGSGTTGSGGSVAFTFSTSATGTFCAKATATASGYAAGTGTLSFSVGTAPSSRGNAASRRTT